MKNTPISQMVLLQFTFSVSWIPTKHSGKFPWCPHGWRGQNMLTEAADHCPVLTHLEEGDEDGFSQCTVKRRAWLSYGAVSPWASVGGYVFIITSLIPFNYYMWWWLLYWAPISAKNFRSASLGEDHEVRSVFFISCQSVAIYKNIWCSPALEDLPVLPTVTFASMGYFLEVPPSSKEGNVYSGISCLMFMQSSLQVICPDFIPAQKWTSFICSLVIDFHFVTQSYLPRIKRWPYYD